MVDLEKDALKRDRAFLVRVVLIMTVGIVLGLVAYAKLTDSRVAGCATSGFMQLTR